MKKNLNLIKRRIRIIGVENVQNFFSTNYCISPTYFEAENSLQIMNRLRVETSGNCAVCKHNRPDCKINKFFLIAAIFWCIKNAHKVVEKSALGVYKFRWLKTDLKAAHLLYPFCTPFRPLLNSFCTGLAAIFAAKACARSIFAAIKKATLAKKAK